MLLGRDDHFGANLMERTIEAFEDRKGIAAVRGILGEKQWAAFKAEYKPTLRDLNSLMEPIAEAMGLDGPGE